MIRVIHRAGLGSPGAMAGCNFPGGDPSRQENVMLDTPAQRYVTLSRWLHLLLAAIIVASWALIRMKGWFPRGSAERASVSALHEQLGIAVLLLAALRLQWRWNHPVRRI